MPEYTIKREEIMVMFKSLVSSTNQDTNQANQSDNISHNSTMLLSYECGQSINSFGLAFSVFTAVLSVMLLS